MSFELLSRALEELEPVLTGCGVKLIVGGGFGIFLLQTELLQDEGIRTIIEREVWCAPRTTADIDIILETHIVANLGQFQVMRQGLDRLQYEVVDSAKYMHFEKHFSDTERVEINFLTGPIQDLSLQEKIHFNRPRVRPRGDVQLHAYLTEQAIGLDTVHELVGRHNLFVPSTVTC